MKKFSVKAAAVLFSAGMIMSAFPVCAFANDGMGLYAVEGATVEEGTAATLYVVVEDGAAVYSEMDDTTDPLCTLDYGTSVFVKGAVAVNGEENGWYYCEEMNFGEDGQTVGFLKAEDLGEYVETVKFVIPNYENSLFQQLTGEDASWSLQGYLGKVNAFDEDGNKTPYDVYLVRDENTGDIFTLSACWGEEEYQMDFSNVIYTAPEEGMTGAWAVNEDLSTLDEEAAKVYFCIDFSSETEETAAEDETAAESESAAEDTEETVYPELLGLISTQVVAGTNYQYLIRYTVDPEIEGQDYMYELLTVYEDLEGNCEVTDETLVQVIY